jgi:PAS domain S-box-containing protein
MQIKIFTTLDAPPRHRARGKHSVILLDSMEKEQHNDLTKTDRRDADSKERLLEDALKSTPDCFSVTDLHDTILFVNPAFCTTYGYTEKELIGKHIGCIRSSNNSPEVVQQILPATLAGGWNGVVLNKKKDGTEFPIELWTSVVRDNSGAPVALFGIGRDISERKLAEERLQKSTERLQLTLDNLNVVAFELDVAGKFLLSRGKGLEKLGLKPDEVVGLSIYDIYKDYPTIIDSFKRTLEGTTQHTEVEINSVVWSANYIPLRELDGHVHRVFGTAIDITERKRAEEELRQSEARSRILVEHAPEAIVVLDFEKRTFENVNENACRLFKLKREEMLTKGPAELSPPIQPDGKPSDESALEKISRAVAGESIHFEWTHRNADGEDIPCEVYLTRLPSSMQTLIRGSIIDITDRKHAEDALHYESNLWHTLMDNIPDTIYFKDRESRFTRINQAQIDVLGIANATEALGKTDADFFSAEHARKTFEEEQKIIQSGISMVGKIEKVLTRTEKSFWFSTTKVPIRDRAGEIVGIVGSSRDITDIKQAEELESALYRIAQKTSTTEDMQEFYSAIHGIIGELMHAKNFYIALYDETEDVLSFPYFVDEVDTPSEPGAPGRGLTAYVLRTGKPLLCSQEYYDELEKRGEVELVGIASPIWLGVPLIIEKKTIGVMVVQHYSDPDAYTEREQHILEFVSSQVAKAIEHKRAEEALRESEIRYRTFVGQSSEGIWRLELKEPIPISLSEDEQIALMFKNTYLAECNDAMARMYGYSDAIEILGTKLSDLLQPTDARNSELLRAFIQSGYRLTEAESHDRDKNGNPKFFLNNLLGIIEGGEFRQAWGTRRDITKRRRAEDLLKFSEEKYRTLFEESQDGIFLSTPDGKLVDVNPAGVEMLGYSSKEELLKVDIAKDLYFNPDDREEYKRNLMRQGYVIDFEFTIKRKDGSKRIVLESASSVRDNVGNIVAYRGFVRDITERKKLEDQFRQSQKMEGIGTLAGGIAHDFNNLLGIILGYTTLIESGSLDPEKYAQSLDTIKKAVDRGAGLVRQLLTFARKADPSFESVNINETVSELGKMLQQTFPKTLNIIMDLHEEMPSIVADTTQVHQALLNLCVNARDAMTESAGSLATGTLSISTGFVGGASIRQKFSAAVANEYVIVRVGDTGVGMDDATRSRIFEPFFTTKERGKGTGLGLAVVYGVINSHHGFIDVESEKGKGTTFILYFPVQSRTIITSVNPASPKVEEANGKETILLVEDEEMLLDLLKSLLEEQGYHVLTAKDGLEGLETYKSHKETVALVLSDMGLPKMGGWDMFQKMREVNPKVLAILASGYFDPTLKLDMLKAGAKDFIQKPYVSNEILARIREILDGTTN